MSCALGLRIVGNGIVVSDATKDVDSACLGVTVPPYFDDDVPDADNPSAAMFSDKVSAHGDLLGRGDPRHGAEAR